MRILLDTHALLWWLADDERLSFQAKKLLTDPTAVVFVSAACIWEIEIKRSLKKLRIPKNWIPSLKTEGFEELPIYIEHAELAASLPYHHRDPFDRMLIAQAKLEKLVLLSHDKIMSKYQVECRW